MRSPWNNAVVVLDAGTLRVWAGPGWQLRRDGVPRVVVEHGGRPADALAAVLGDLPRARLPMQNRLQIIVGYPWTHCVVVPWQDGVLSASAWDAYARSLFAARAQRGALRIRIEDAPYGRARLAVAACEATLEALADVSRAAGWRTVSCRDALSASLCMHGRRLVGDDYRFALLQPRVGTCLFRRAGEWADAITLPRLGGGHIEEWLTAAALMGGQRATDVVYASTFGVSMPLPDMAGVTLLDGMPAELAGAATSAEGGA